MTLRAAHDVARTSSTRPAPTTISFNVAFPPQLEVQATQTSNSKLKLAALRITHIMDGGPYRLAGWIDGSLYKARAL